MAAPSHSAPILTTAQTLLNCIDNSGAAIVECINVLKMKRAATIGSSQPSTPNPIALPTHTRRSLSSTQNSHGSAGDRIVVVVQKQRNFGPETGPSSSSAQISAANKVRRGDIRHAVIVRTKKKIQRKDGSVVRFDDNACVLISKNGEPIGSRMTGVVGKEVREKGWSKILSLAPVHV